MNTVNEDNFNETCKGYIIRALKIIDATNEEKDRILNGLRWAFDELTMSEARKEYDRYYTGKINFKRG